MRTQGKRTAAGVVLCLCLAMPVLNAATWYVDASRPDDSGDGTNWVTAKKTIHAGVAAATGAGDVILAADGDYPLTNTVALTGRTLRGDSGNRAAVVIYGNDTFRCIALNSGARLEGVSIAHGSNSSYGGGVYIYTSTVSNCIVRDCAALTDGGGIDLRADGILVDSMVCSNTAASDGGGIAVVNGNANTLISRCIISNNHADAGNGGGIYQHSGGCVIQNSTVTVNSASAGGGIGCFGADNVIVSQTLICANSGGASGGGGFWARSAAGSTTAHLLVDCQVVSNQSTGNGGGVSFYAGTAGSASKIVNCRVEDNTLTAQYRQGAGIYINWPGTVVSNCVVAGNHMDAINCDGAGIAISGAAVTNVVVTDCLVSNNYGGRYAGGVYILAPQVVLDRNRIVANAAATRCGGIYCVAASAGTLIRNSLIADNWATDYAGGISFDAANRVESCTVAGNRSTNNTGGIRASVAGSVILNTIVYSNTVVNGTTSNWLNTVADAAVYTNCCVTPLAGLPGTDNREDNPLFIAPDTVNYRIAARSPCRRAGLNDLTWMANGVDLDGNPRIGRFDGTVDIGAYRAEPHVGTIWMLR